MKPLWIGMIVFVCTLGGALLGMWLRATLPPEHLRDESRDTVRLGIGLVATLTALVLGLMTASAKSSFDTLNTSIRSMAADVLATDRLLARYGPETKDIRETLKRVVAHRMDEIWSNEPSRDAPKLAVNKESETGEWIVDQIRALAPSTAAQRALQSRASDQAEVVLRSRWVVLGELGTAIPWPFLIVLVFWLTITFTSFGLQAPANATVLAVLILCALSVAGAVFLTLEMDGPYDGLIQVSPDPVRFALSRLGQ
jgi:Protein of unknown function (DUF4239)